MQKIPKRRLPKELTTDSAWDSAKAAFRGTQVEVRRVDKGVVREVDRGATERDGTRATGGEEEISTLTRSGH